MTRAYAAERWARAVVRFLDAPDDVRTVAEWGRAIGVGHGTLRTWCATAKLSAKRSLDLARLLRVVWHGQKGPWRPADVLNIVDSRTLIRLLKQGGVDGTTPITVANFLLAQTLITDAMALDELRKALKALLVLPR